jgi:hypothetical protein
MLNEIKLLNSNTELNRLASNVDSYKLQEDSSLTSNETLSTAISTEGLYNGSISSGSSESTVIRRPLSDKSKVNAELEKDSKSKSDIVVEDVVGEETDQKNE